MVFQKTISLRSYPRGFHIITSEVEKHLPKMTGIVNVFIKHTSASLTINENADPSVRKDFETHLATIFTEVRLKKYIEIRSLDTCEWDCHCAGPAFYTGLIYGNLDEALEIIDKWKISDVLNAYAEAPKKGLKTLLKCVFIHHLHTIFALFPEEPIFLQKTSEITHTFFSNCRTGNH